MEWFLRNKKQKNSESIIDIKLLLKENKQLKENFSKNVLDLIKNRRSIRKFSDMKISDKIIYEIIEAGINAPCAGNIQNYKIIIVKDNLIKEKISKISYEQYWIKTAPIVLVIVRDNNLCENMYPLDGKRFSIQNVSALIENLIIAISSQNLATTWIGSTENDVLKEFLEIPKTKIIDAILPIGYPLETPEIQKMRIDNLIFYNKYGNMLKPTFISKLKK